MSANTISAIAQRHKARRQAGEETRRQIQAQNLKIAVTASIEARNKPKLNFHRPPRNLIPIPLSSLFPLSNKPKIIHWGDTPPEVSADVSSESELEVWEESTSAPYGDNSIIPEQENINEIRSQVTFSPIRVQASEVDLQDGDGGGPVPPLISKEQKICEASRILKEGRKLLGIEAGNRELINFKFEPYNPSRAPNAPRNQPLKVLPNRNLIAAVIAKLKEHSRFQLPRLSGSESELSSSDGGYRPEFRRVLPGRNHIHKSAFLGMKDYLDNLEPQSYHRQRLNTLLTPNSPPGYSRGRQSTSEESIFRPGSRILSPATPPTKEPTTPVLIGAGDRISPRRPIEVDSTTNKNVGEKTLYQPHLLQSLWSDQKRSTSVEKLEKLFRQAQKSPQNSNNELPGPGGETIHSK